MEDKREAGRGADTNRQLRTFRQDPGRAAGSGWIDVRRQNRTDQIIQGGLAYGSFSYGPRPDQLMGGGERGQPAMNCRSKISRGRRSVIFWAQSRS